MKPNNYTSRLLLLVFAGCCLAACSDDNSNEEETPKGYPTTSFSKIQLSETIPSDAQTVTATHTYTYKSGRLSAYTSLQEFAAIEPIELKSQTTVTYGDRQAVVANDYGNVSTYLLNDKGYAVSCTRQEGGGDTRTYTFAYLTDNEHKCALKNVTETLEDGTIYSSIDIDYIDDKTLYITQKVDAQAQTFIATTQAEEHAIENSSEIPCLFLAELYPMSLHSTALYGKLLGEPFDILVTQITPEGDSAGNEKIDYTYMTDEQGIVTSCRQVTNSYGTNFVRTVNYLIE